MKIDKETIWLVSMEFMLIVAVLPLLFLPFAMKIKLVLVGVPVALFFAVMLLDAVKND